MCIIERSPSYHSLGSAALEQGDVQRAVETFSEGIRVTKEEDHHKRAAILADRSQAFLSLGDRSHARIDSENACLEDRFWPEGHFRRSKAYEAMGALERAQEAAMQAYLLEPTSEEYFHKVQDLTHNIGRTDYGVGPTNISKEQLHYYQRTGELPLVNWSTDEEPGQWYRKDTVQTMGKSLPFTILHSLELAIHNHILTRSVLTKGRLCIHLAGATSEHEGISDFAILFDKLPQLEELHVVQVGYLGMFGPCKSIVPDPQAPPPGKLVSTKHCLGNGRSLVVRKFKGMYHEFLEASRHHQFEGKGYLHEAPDVVVLANPGLDVFFHRWAPTLRCLRDAEYLTVVTGGNLDHSRRHHNLIMQAMGVKIALRLRTSRFGIVHARRVVKNHNLMAFKGPNPLLQRPPKTGEEVAKAAEMLQKLGVELELKSASATVNNGHQHTVLHAVGGSNYRGSNLFVSQVEDGETDGSSGSSNSSINGGNCESPPTDKCCAALQNLLANNATTTMITMLKAEEQRQHETDEAEETAAAVKFNEKNNQSRHLMDIAAADGGGSTCPTAATTAERQPTAAPGTERSPGWHCRSFRKTPNGILVVET